mgnify:CR=1 FL=1
MKVWLNDRLVDEKDARISVFDHGVLYGDGVFEGIRVYNGKIFDLKEHLQRLYQSAKAIRLEVFMDIDQMSDAVQKTVDANGVENGYIRLVVTRGEGSLGLNPFVCKNSQIFIIADDIQLYPEELYEEGMKVISASTVRNHPLSLPPQIKSMNYLNNILAKMEAIDSDVPEAVMYNHEGNVAEATGDNVFIVKKGIIYTPPTEAGALEGITRNSVIMIAEREGYKVVERDLTKFDLYTSDEFFLTGTAAEVIAVTKVDKQEIGDGKVGPVTNKLLAAFRDYIERTTKA